MTTLAAEGPTYTVRLRKPHPKQQEFLDSPAKRKVIRAGRRGGKTTGTGILAVRAFLDGRRVLYAAPTQEQVDAFWWEVKRALAEPIDAGVFVKNESLHIIELPGTKQRIRAKTAWNADTLRGDYADLLILDEWQLMDEQAWELVGAPMLLDNDGDAVFVYTPPSLRSRSVSKARDPRHAARMFERARADGTGRWEAFHFTSRDNPHISASALRDLAADMTELARRQEIEAEDLDEPPGALWKREQLEALRIVRTPELVRVVVAIDPPADSRAEGSGAGIVACGLDASGKAYVLEDASLEAATPDAWGRAAVSLYHRLGADRIVGEQNNGGEMVEHVIRSVDSGVSYKAVRASRGKAVRAEPVAALFEQRRVFLAGVFPELEEELSSWEPGADSPHRLDALVWAITELMLGVKKRKTIRFL